MLEIEDDDDLIMISSDGIIIRIYTAEINLTSRPGRGVKIMRIDDGVKLLSVARYPR